MHQAIAPPRCRRGPPKKRAPAENSTSFSGIGLIVSWLVIASILGKREKPIPVTTEKALRTTIANGLGHRQSAAGNRGEDFSGSRRRDHRVAGRGWQGSEKGRPDDEDPARFLQGPRWRSSRPRSARRSRSSGSRKPRPEKAEAGSQAGRGSFPKKLISQTEMLAAQTAQRCGEIDVRKLACTDRGREGELEPGARSAFQDDDLFARSMASSRS